ncbi:MAG: TIR domain-containing protein [Cyanobacteria bacterium P01_C01_bin.121]
MNPPQDAFISYGRADSKQFAKRLRDHLVGLGYTVWFDFEDIPLGVDYQKQIDDGIDKADNFLFIISPHAVNSPYCRLEIEQALYRQKRIIPLMHVEQISRETWHQRHPNGTDAQWTEYQSASKHSSYPNLHPEIRKINWVSFREGVDDFVQSLQGLCDLLERQKDYVHQHTVLLSRALAWEEHQKRTRYLLIGEERQHAEAWLSTQFKTEQPPCLPTDLHCEFITESIKNASNLMTQVFLCHAEQDRETAEQVRRTLMRSGITTWTHRTDIEYGSDFHDAMTRGMEEADNVVFLLSPHSLESQYCQQELNHALELHKRIIPLKAAAVPPEEIPKSLKTLQYIDLTDNLTEADYQQDESDLLRILRQDTAYHYEHKVLLTKALKWKRQQHNPCILLRGYELQHAEAWLKLAQQYLNHAPLSLQTEFITASQRQPPGIGLDVFVSYSRADSDFARKLNDGLQRQGKRTWFDQESIASGADFQQEIYKGIEASDHFLFILSPKSVNSPYCADEVEYAAQLNKRIVTVRHRAVEAADLHPELAKVQWVDFQGRDQDFAVNFQELLRTLDADPEHLRFHTRLLMQAIAWDERGRREGRLLRGEDLREAEQWLLQAAGKQPSPTALQGEYVAASRRAMSGQQRRLVAILGSLLVAAVLSGVFGYVQWARALEQTRRAENQTRIAEQAEADAQADRDRAVQAEQDARRAAEEAESAKNNEAEAALRAENARDAAEQALQEAQAAQENAEAAQAAEAVQRRLAEEKTQEATAALATADEQRRRAVEGEEEAEKQARSAEAQTEVLIIQDLMASGLQLQASLKAIALGQNIKDVEAIAPQVKFQAASTFRAIYHLDGYLMRNILQGHDPNPPSVHTVRFSDGHIIAAASDDGTVKLWDRQGRELKSLPQQTKTATESATGQMSWMNFSPDGQTIAYLTKDGVLRLWDLRREELTTIQDATSSISSVSFSPDSEFIVTGDSNGTVKRWNRQGQMLDAAPENHNRNVNLVAYPNTQTIISASSRAGRIRVWNLPDNSSIVLPVNAPFTTLSLSPDGETIAVPVDDTVKRWNRQGQELATLRGHLERVNAVAFSPHDQTVISAGDDGLIIRWHSQGENPEILQSQLDSITALELSANGQKIAVAGNDGTVRLWDEQKQELQTIQSSLNPEVSADPFAPSEPYTVNSLSFSPDDQLIITGADDGRVRLWSRSNRDIKAIQGGNGRDTSISFSPDGQVIASAGAGGTVELWNRQGQALSTINSPQLGGRVYSVTFSPDGQVIASAGARGAVRLWNRQEQEPQVSIDHALVNSVSFSPDGQILASAGDRGTVRLWNRQGQEQGSFEIPENTDSNQIKINEISFSPDGQIIAAASEDNKVRLWHRQSRQLQVLEGHRGPVNSVRFSPGGQVIATASEDETVRLWNRQGQLLQVLDGHEEAVNSVSFFPDGDVIASASDDRTVRLWNLQGQLLQVLDGHEEAVNSVSFAPDGQTLVSIDSQGELIFWDFDLKSLTAKGCSWLQDYLTFSHHATDDDKALCSNERHLSSSSTYLEQFDLLANIQNSFNNFFDRFVSDRKS